MQMPETAGIPIALLAHHLRSSTVFALPPTPLCPLLPAYNICAFPIGYSPLRRNQTVPFKSVKNWVEDTVRPFKHAAGQDSHPLDDLIPITISIKQDRYQHRLC